MGIKEDPGACKTSPTDYGKEFRGFEKGVYIKLVACRFRILYMDSGPTALKAELERVFTRHVFKH